MYTFKFVLLMSILSLSAFSANAKTLSDYTWEKRLLIVNQSLTSDTQIANLSKFKDEIQARRLLIFLLQQSTVKAYSTDETYVELTDEIKNRLKGSAAVLIGLDGATKRTYKSLSIQEVFANIDTMPMRRSELKQQ